MKPVATETQGGSSSEQPSCVDGRESFARCSRSMQTENVTPDEAVYVFKLGRRPWLGYIFVIIIITRINYYCSTCTCRVQIVSIDENPSVNTPKTIPVIKTLAKCLFIVTKQYFTMASPGQLYEVFLNSF